MGNGQSTSYLKDTFKLEEFSHHSELQHDISGMAFDKCVDTSAFLTTTPVTLRLTASEQKCVNEYARLYASYAKSSYKTFMHLYDQHERMMIMKMQQEAMARGQA